MTLKLSEALQEAWETEDNFPLMWHRDDDIKNVINFDGDLSVETWIDHAGIVINFLMGRFGSTHKDIKAKWGYSDLAAAIADAPELLK